MARPVIFIRQPLDRRALERTIEQHLDAVTALILELDACDGDPDLEDGGDAEATEYEEE